jgi:DNA-binding NtrC family response regulator
MELFFSYDWPGNVRELKHLVERLVIFSKDREITEKDLYFAGFELSKRDESMEEIPVSIPVPKDKAKILPLEEVERIYILKVLDLLKWNKSLTAQVLGIDRKTLRDKLKKWKFS